MTGLVPLPKSAAPSLDKGTPGESRGRKATGPRLLRDALLDATKDPTTAELPKGRESPPHRCGEGLWNAWSFAVLLLYSLQPASTRPPSQHAKRCPPIQSFAVIGRGHFEVTPEAGLFVHNECSGEDVHLIEGKFQFVLTETLNENGSHGYLHQVSAGVRGIRGDHRTGIPV